MLSSRVVMRIVKMEMLKKGKVFKTRRQDFFLSGEKHSAAQHSAGSPG